MSPVSRGRGKKNRSAKGPRGRRAPVRALPAETDQGLGAEDGAPGERRSARTTQDAIHALARSLPGAARIEARARAWWPASHTEVLGSAAGLLDAAEPRAGEVAVRHLLHGIGAIAPPAPADRALTLLRQAVTRPGGEAEDEVAAPPWLDVPPVVSAAADVVLLRDVYGLRYGLVAQVTVADAPARSYLFDVDLCHGFERVVRCGYHADADAAAAAWRDGVGASAAGAAPQPVPSDLLPRLLTGSVHDGPFAAHPSDEGFRELYRADRVAHEIFAALERVGRPADRPRDDLEQGSLLAEDLAGRLRDWAAERGVDLPPAASADEDVVRWMLSDWVSPGLDERLALSCSPHRIAAFVAYLNDDWTRPVRDQALRVLEPWARYCLEASGVTGEAAEHTLDWAARAAREPEAVAGDLANHLDAVIDETTVARSG